MGRQPEPDTTQYDESGYESVGKREMLWALESIVSAIEEGSVTTSDYYIKFTTAKYNEQAGNCNRRCRRSPSYEPELSVEMLVAVKTAFEDVENGSLKEGGYYFELSTPHFQFTSGRYPRKEKDGSICVDDKQEPILCSPDNKSLVGSLLYMIQVVVVLETVNMLLLASPVGAYPITGEEQPLTLTAGENGIIPFACRNEQQSASKYYTVKFEEKDRPFYIDGAFDPEGLMSPDQAERFRVEYFEQDSAMSVEINVASVSIEDQGTYVVFLIIQGKTPENHVMKKVVLIFIPPSPAICYIMPSESMITKYEVHCHSRPGNGDSTLTCFQNGEKIPFRLETGVNTPIVYRRIFWLMHKDIPVSCCSHDIEKINTITQKSCEQYRYPQIQPVNSPVSPAHQIPTKMAPTTRPLSMEENKNQLSLETTSYSGCGRNFYWPAVILPIMAFFTYMCISNP